MYGIYLYLAEMTTHRESEQRDRRPYSSISRERAREREQFFLLSLLLFVCVSANAYICVLCDAANHSRNAPKRTGNKK